jgi:hypothetical protein
MAAGRDRDLLWPIKTRRNDEMNLPAMKTSVLSRIGLRRGVPTALALVATLALVSSAHAQTYTWTGAGSDNNWFTNNATFASGNFSSTPLVSSLTTTDLVFEGSTRPSSTLNLGSSPATFSTKSVTFNTTVDFTITGPSFANRGLVVGLGGIDNQVAFKQSWGGSGGFIRIDNSGTTPIHVASGGEFAAAAQIRNFSVGAFVNKTGAGTLTLAANNTLINNLIVSAGTVNVTGANTTISADVQGGILNMVGNTDYGFDPDPSRANSYFRQSAGVTNLGGHIATVVADITGGTLNFTTDVASIGSKTTISGGTVAYTGPAGGGTYFGSIGGSQDFTTAPILTITGGVQNFGAGTFDGPFDTSGISVLVTGGTSTGFYRTQGLTNTGTGGPSTGGSITFTALANTTALAAKNTLADLTLTSGTVSIGTVAGGATAIGSLVNGSTSAPLNTFLGAGNTLNLDFNQDLTRDLLITSGTLNWDGIVALNLTNSGTIANGTSWNFFNDGVLGNTGAFTGTLDGISLTASSIYTGLAFSKSGSLWTSTATPGGQQFTFNETTGVLAVVPEPSSIAAAGIGLAMLGWRRLARRRRAAA